MSGIIVGIDGSGHSQLALEWAMREAVIRRQPLTVITVEQVAASGWHGMVVFPADEHFLAEARTAAEDLVEKVTAQLGEATPPPVTLHAVFGLPAEKLIEASEDADLLVVGSRGTGASPGCCWARSAPRSSTTRTARWPSSLVSATNRRPDRL